MATSKHTVGWNNTSAASFLAWGSATSAAFAAIGMTQTADTGQINWTSFTPPSNPGASGNTMFGYEIWKVPDAPGVAGSIYIKFSYGNGFGGGGTGYPVMTFSVGTGTNGSGSVTGITMPAPTVWGVGPNGSTAGIVGNFYASAGPGRLSFCGAVNDTPEGVPSPFMFCLERSRNTDGTSNGTGFWLCSSAAPGSSQQIAANAFFGLPSGVSTVITAPGGGGYGGLNVLSPGGGISQAAKGLSVPVYPITPVYGKVQNPVLSVLIGKRDDFFSGTPPYDVPIMIYGAVHTYKVMLASVKHAGIWGGGSSYGLLGASANQTVDNVCPLMIWE